MDGERKLTDCFQVVRDGKTRVSTCGRETAKNQGNTVRGKKLTAERKRKHTQETQIKGLLPLDQLREFDLDWHFGPCSGITRLERWKRAKELGLCPPEIILEILLAHSADPAYQHSLWHGYDL
ncbi:DNA polymerase delta subunit 4 [Pelodytes ibericus]